MDTASPNTNTPNLSTHQSTHTQTHNHSSLLFPLLTYAQVDIHPILEFSCRATNNAVPGRVGVIAAGTGAGSSRGRWILGRTHRTLLDALFALLSLNDSVNVDACASM